MFKYMKKSIAFQTIVVIGVVIVTGLFVLVGLQLRMFTLSTRQSFETNNIIKTQLLTTQVAGGLKWKKAEVINSLYNELLKNEDANLSSAYAFHTTAGKISLVHSDFFPAFDFDQFVAEHQDLNGEAGVKTFTSGDNFVVYVPAFDVKASENKSAYLGGVLIAWSTQSMAESLNSTLRIQVVVSLLIVVLLVVSLFILLRKFIVSPLNKNISVMSRLAQGEYDIEIPQLNRPDEIGVMSRALEVFKRNAFEKENAEKEKVNATQRL